MQHLKNNKTNKHTDTKQTNKQKRQTKPNQKKNPEQTNKTTTVQEASELHWDGVWGRAVFEGTDTFWSTAISRLGMNWKGSCVHSGTEASYQKLRISFSSQCVSGLSQLVSGQIPTEQLVFSQITTEQSLCMISYVTNLFF